MHTVCFEGRQAHDTIDSGELAGCTVVDDEDGYLVGMSSEKDIG
jgi:hypothetical protein